MRHAALSIEHASRLRIGLGPREDGFRDSGHETLLIVARFKLVWWHEAHGGRKRRLRDSASVSGDQADSGVTPFRNSREPWLSLGGRSAFDSASRMSTRLA